MDPLNDALREATLAVLLGSTDVQHQTVDTNGHVLMGTVTIPSAFQQRISALAAKGEFDTLIRQAIDALTPADLLDTLKAVITKEMLARLEPVQGRGYNDPSRPGWLQGQARSIATEACTSALAADETLLDTLRARIGAEVDRNRVGITVNLSDPEAS